MISVEILLGFIFTSIILCFAPGPDNIFVLTQSALHGRTSGIYVTLGLCTGLVIYSIAVAFGVAVIFRTSTFAFNSLKVIGACYLAYLSWQAFRAKPKDLNDKTNKEINQKKLYFRGVIMNLTNPKVCVFFLAFLPQFASPAKGPIWLQILFFGAVFILCTVFVFCGIAVLAGTLGTWLNRSQRVQLVLNKIAGTVFLILAITLLMTDI